MNPADDTKETVTFRAISGDEEGQKRVEKVEVEIKSQPGHAYAR